MDIKEIKEYADVFERLKLTEMSVKINDCEIIMKKESGHMSSDTTKEKSPVTATALTENETASGSFNDNAAVKTVDAIRDAGDDANLTLVKSPLLGVFYSGLGDKPFVNVGDYVKKGDILCVVEAMKMFNDILADKEGYIREVCAKDGELVEYNQVLFKISD